MPPLFAKSVTRLDAIYRDRPFFDGVRARLLAGFILVLLAFAPVNMAAMLWSRPAYFLARITSNLVMALVAVVAARLLFKGRLALAGSVLLVALVVPMHTSFLLPGWLDPLGLQIKVFSFDMIYLLAALVFTSRRVASAVLVVIVATHAAFYYQHLHDRPIAGTLESAATTLRHDGLAAICFIFFLGLVVIRMIETSHRRSDEALRQTRALNENLEHLVAERTRELERLNDEKNAFLGMAAHDLRNPAVKIRMITETVQFEGDYSEGRMRAELAAIGETATRQLGLLNDLLDVTAIEEGRVSLRPVPLDARAILRGVHAEFAGPAAAKGLELVLVSPAATAPATLPALLDPAAIGQVLDNLVSNALKYSPAGKRVWLSAEAVPGDRVRFAVRDEGPGLSEADRAKLFGKFSRLSAQPTGGESSTGLGLSIVKRLVDRMAGTIGVDSVLGHGATFRADFPAA
jgi:signal transduction histidine kinase